MTPKVPSVKFYNGNEIPVIGLGTWKSRPGEVTQAVKDAIDAGYRHFDCARAYENETEVGDAIHAKIAEGVVRREDIFITSKLWNNSHKQELVEPAIRKTLGDLRVSYVDLYLIHNPMAFAPGEDLLLKNPEGIVRLTDDDYLDTWKGMEAIFKKGLAKNIGISNFNSQQVDRLLKHATIKPVTNQVEVHPYLTQVKLSEFCKARDIIITAYSPLGSPDSPLVKPEDPKILEDKRLLELAKKYKKTVAQIALRYQVDRGHVVIPKSIKKSRIIENINIFDFKLTPEDVKYIDSFDRNARYCVLPGTKNSIHFPFNIPF